MKSAHLLLLLLVVNLVGCMQKRQTSYCSSLIEIPPQLELKVDTLYAVKKYDVKSNIQQSCPVEKVTWTFMQDQIEHSTSHALEDEFVTIPHRMISINSSYIQLSVTFSDGGYREWHFPILDLISEPQ